jgi:Xaa-Pro aminopeptidase
VLAKDGRGGMLVPRLEVEHAHANSAVKEIAHYDEYPGERHPIESLRELLEALAVRSPFGADAGGYPWIFGYRGPGLGEFVHIADVVEDQMMIKSDAEIALLRESAKWGNLAHRLLQRYTRPGLTETEVSARASVEATAALLDAIGPIYRPQSPWIGLGGGAAFAIYRGQIGRNAGATAPVWGYHSSSSGRW